MQFSGNPIINFNIGVSLMDYQEMTFDQWEAIYKPIKNPFSDDAEKTDFDISCDKEMAFVSQHIERNAVWTWKDDNDGEPDYIVSGCWRINRLGYYVTQVPYQGERGDIAVNFD
jgi:hypothetical protein